MTGRVSVQPSAAARPPRGTGPRRATLRVGPWIAVPVRRSSLPAALVTVVLLLLADLAAQQLPLFDNLPVGIYTMAVGGAYLGRLLIREWRRHGA
ncbi:hypothetical protein ABZ667_31245 [Streptomyces lavendulae]|uniref:hypothetical protein n=1 Tax=Streptomyces lavendulae TaxID=1914 RepID=UPI0033F8B706